MTSQGSTGALPRRSVLITDAARVLAPAIDHLKAAGVTVVVADEDATPSDIVTLGVEIPVMVTGFMPFGRSELEHLESTDLIVRAGVGYDSIDIPAATDAGIWIANVPDFCIEEVADHTILLLLAAARRLPDAMTLWRTTANWSVNSMLPDMQRIRGKRLGLIGFGRIGQLVAERALAFGWSVSAYDPNVSESVFADAGVSPMGLEDLLGTSDAVSLHCPLTEDTYHLINADRLAGAREGLTLINTSRGGLVDLADLNAALESGKVAYAGLDVLDGEPDPDLTQPLLTRANVLITSHSGWRSIDAVSELADKTAKQAIQFLDGEVPSNLVNPSARSL